MTAVTTQDTGLERIRNIEAGRAVAAILVVFYHIDKYYFSSARYWREDFLGGLFSFGHAGVEFFFVLSGLLMTMIHFDDLGKAGRLVPFVKKRFARIYPFYWACLALLFVVVLVVPALATARPPTLMRMLPSIVLAGDNPLNTFLFVAWTLYHEVLFYAVFALAIWRPKIGVPLALIWFATCFAFAREDEATLYPLKFINVLFLFGIGTGLVLRRATVPLPGLLAALGTVLFLATGLDDAYFHLLSRPPQIAAYGLGAAMVLVGSVMLERQGRMVAPAALVLAGQASYSIYLTHMLVLAVSAKLALRLGIPGWLPGPIGFVGLAAAAILGGIVVHRLVEKPLVRATRRRLG